MQKTIIIGSRGSDLALWQANFLKAELAAQGYDSTIKIIKTQGDKIQHLSLEKLEGKGFFTKEIEDALYSGHIDVAVHSHKDLPTEKTPGLIIAAVSHREDPSELLLIRRDKVDILNQFHLADNAVVGTSSSRRTVQLGFFRPDLICKDIRGNVPTRIQKLRNGDFDAILLAFAGVHRLKLNIDDLHAVKIAPEKFVPSPAQGVLAFQCRENDEPMITMLSKIHHADVAETINVERKVMNLFQGGCHMPLGVYCEKVGGKFNVYAAQATEKDLPIRRLFLSATNTINLAETIFERLPATVNKSIFITSPEADHPQPIQLLKQKGFNVTAKSCVDIIPLEFNFSGHADWLFFSSKNGVQHFFNKVTTLSDQIKIAAIGEATAAAIHAAGYNTYFVGEGTMLEIANNFKPDAENAVVIFPAALNRNNQLATFISEYATVSHLPVYGNILGVVDTQDADILVFTSALNVDGYLQYNNINATQTIIAIGSTTAGHLNALGYQHVFQPPQQSMLSIAELICGLF